MKGRGRLFPVRWAGVGLWAAICYGWRMDGKRPLRERRRSAVARLALSLVLLLTPLGAPAVGFLLLSVCDFRFLSTVPQPPQCFLPTPLSDYFAGMLFVALTSGSIIIAILWGLLAAGLLLAFLIYAVKTAWLFGVERLADEKGSDEMDSRSEQS